MAASSVSNTCALQISCTSKTGNGLISLYPTRSRATPIMTSNGSRLTMRVGERKEGTVEMAVPAATMAILTAAAMVVPDIAEAAAPGVSPSLKNLLLSVLAGGVVLVAIGAAVAGVSTFDPVQRK